MSLRKYVLSVDRVVMGFEDALKLFNTMKPHTYYQKLRILRPIAKRTGDCNLTIIYTTIPQTRRPEKLEYLAIIIYITKERIMQKSHFVKRLEYIVRLLRKLMSKDGGAWWHVFIYFVGRAFRAGVYEEAARSRKVLISRGLDVNLRLIEARYGGDLLNTIYDDLLGYLGSRAYRILSSGSFSRSEGKVFGRLKHLLDYIIAVLASLRDGEGRLLRRVEDVMGKREVSADEYLGILRELGYVGAKKSKAKVATSEVRPQPQTYLPTIRYTKQNLSEDSEEGIEDEEEGYEVVKDRYEPVEDYERL